MRPEIRRFDNANSLYYSLVEFLGQEIKLLDQGARDPVLALPTGNTMVPFYKIAAEKQDFLQVHRWSCFNLDEYYPLTPELIPHSFKTYLETHFYSKLKTAPKRTACLNGMAENFMIECDLYEDAIKKSGGLDFAILGVGMNGHIAFNEPGSEFFSRTRAIGLHPQTLMTNFRGPAPFSHALTLGIGTLLEARRVIVVALGKSKAQVVRAAIEEVQTRTLPASALQSHPKVIWFVDQEAASLLRKD